MTFRNRYTWLIVDTKRMGLIIMDERRDRRGRTVFEVPAEYREYLHLRGIEVVPATIAEAAEYLHKRLNAMTNPMPEDCCDWFAVDLQARREAMEAAN